MKRILCLLFAALLCFSALTACQTPDSQPSVTPSETPTETPQAEDAVILANAGSALFRVVRPEGIDTGSAAVSGAVALRKACKEAGYELPICTDYENADENAAICEILVGNTNRAATKAAQEQLPSCGYCIYYDGVKIAVVGTDETTLAEAVSYLTGTCLQVVSDQLVLSLPSHCFQQIFTPEEKCPMIVATKYPTSDYVVADVIATRAPYNADPTGEKDSTAAIQKALNDCSKLGGGTVWLPVGTYRVTDTITVPCMVTLRGDWRDPDTEGEDYGTVISADVKRDIGTLFLMDQSSGARSLTVYYPNQTAENPQNFGWTFEFRAQGSQGPAIGEITLLNAYRGIGLSAPPYTQNANSNMYIFNVKGTALSEGLTVYNNAGACSYENIHFHNRYWAEAGEQYHAPSIDVLNAYTRKNGIAFTFGDLEMPLIYRLSADMYKYGIYCAKGARMDFWGAGMAELEIRDTDIALYIANHNKPRMSGIVGSVLEGSEAAVSMVSGAYLHIAGCELIGDVLCEDAGKYIVDSDLNTYTETYEAFDGEVRAAKAVLYNVTAEPYNAPCAPVNKEGNLGEDCTEAIQKALDDAGKNGGGIVYLPAGYYTVRGRLTVPAGVELRGSGSVPMAPGPSGGTGILLYDGKNSTNPDEDPAAITLSGDGAGMRYVQLLYPENPFKDKGTLVEFPYTVRIEQAENAYCIDSLFSNPCRGIDITDGSDNHYVKRISGTAAYNLIRVGNTTDGWIETLHDINPGYWTGAKRYGIATPWMTDVFDHFHYFQKANCDLIILNGAENEHLLNILQFGSHYMVTVNGGSAMCVNCLLDQGGAACFRVTDGEVISYNSELTGRGKDVNLTEGGSLEALNPLYIK